MMISATGKKKRAFTLVEALMVVMIVVVMAGIAAPSFNKTFEQMEFNASVGRFQAFLNYFRQRAIVESRVIEVDVDINNGQYWAKYTDDPGIIKTDACTGGVSISGVDHVIRFYPNGTSDKVEFMLAYKNNDPVMITTHGGYGRVSATVQE